MQLPKRTGFQCLLKQTRYCDVWHVRTRIRFAMLKTMLLALQGYRRKKMDKINKPL